MNKLQFTAEDITKKFLEIQKLEGKAKDYSIMCTSHELQGELGRAALNISITRATYHPSDYMDKADFLGLYGMEPNPMQKAYAGNIEARIFLTANSIDNIRHECYQNNIDSLSIQNIERESKKIIDYLDEIIEFIPLTDNLLKIGKLSQQRLEYSKVADFCINNAIYMYNRKFAREFQTATYSIKRDLNNYEAEQFKNITPHENIIFEKSMVADLRNKKDYFGNVFMPLFNNIYNHAFNPKNDVTNRSESLENLWCKSINAYSEIDENNKIITYTIADNGFGIRPEIMDKIFKKGFTTKTDKTTEHGIGLWAVKNFIEENGGRIWVESELGKYTKFSFTVPYDRKELDTYIKD